MASDEDDYMSAAFVTEEGPQARKRKRGATSDGPEAKKQKTLRELEAETRSEGLNKPLDETNVGFRMLAMMGYKVGQGVGKTETGRTEPLPLTIKKTRAGLGLEEERNREVERLLREQKSREGNALESFIIHQRQRFRERKIHGQLRQALRVCATLDEQKGITDNPLLPKPEETDETISTTVVEVDDNTTAPSVLPHVLAEPSSTLDAAASIPLESSEPAQDTLEHKEQFLTRVLEYLRTTHLYCFFCGASYSNKEDMYAHCPGPTEEAHERSANTITT